jgi:peptidoglycan/LPS O-acetylase OafA/YrhL
MRLAPIDQLKGLAIMAVVCYHLDDWRLDIDHKPFLLVIGWCVYAFLFAAGVLHRLKLDAMAPGEFIRQRTVRLLVPFVLIGSLMCTLRQLMEVTMQTELRLRYPPTLLGKIAGHMVLQQPMVAYPLYFFLLLLVISILFKLVKPGLGKGWNLTVCSGAALVATIICWVVTRQAHCTGFGFEMIFMGFFQYAVGYVLASGLTGPEARATWGLITGIGVVGLILGVPEFSLAVVPPLLFVVLSRGSKQGWRLKWLEFLGQRSGTIFAYHIPFVTGLLIVLFYKWGLPVYLNFALTFIATLVICSVLHEVLHRWKVFKWLRV